MGLGGNWLVATYPDLTAPIAKTRMTVGVRTQPISTNLRKRTDMATVDGNVTFHVDGVPYRWHIPSRKVFNMRDELVAKDCYNIQQARAVVERTR
jgi:hypothetical protein